MSSEMTETEWIWKDGEFVRWEDATVHLLSHVVQFGSSVFEGIRCYETPGGAAVFRLHEHIRRLYDSCRIYRMEPEPSPRELLEAVLATIARNGLTDCYIRPMVLRGYGAAGLNPVESPVETYVVTWPWGTYLGKGALERGVDVCVSSWGRPAPNTFPVMAKAAGNYVNAQLIKMDALDRGYVEGIALGPSGLVSEGSGQNIFLIRDGEVLTPAMDGTLLAGITRSAVIDITRELEIPLTEARIPRETLYTAEEIFFTGTATEVTPVRSVDGVQVGEGMMGPVTKRIQKHFMEVVRGEVPDERGWLTLVEG